MAIKSVKNGVETVTFTNCVVKSYAREERVMSDVYDFVNRAVVFNVETNSFDDIPVYNFQLDSITVTVDASPAIESLYILSEEVKAAEAKLNELKRSMNRQIESMKAPVKGRTIKVVKGRKVPVGTVGTCCWVGESRYGVRVGLKTPAGETLWTAASNVEAVI